MIRNIGRNISGQRRIAALSTVSIYALVLRDICQDLVDTGLQVIFCGIGRVRLALRHDQGLRGRDDEIEIVPIITKDP